MDNVKLGNFIKDIMKSKKMSNRDLKEELLNRNVTMSDANISKFLNGKHGTDIHNYKIIADILDITIDELMNMEISDRKNSDRRIAIKFALIGTVVGVSLSSILIATYLFFPHLFTNHRNTVHYKECAIIANTVGCDKGKFVIEYGDSPNGKYLTLWIEDKRIEVHDVKYKYNNKYYEMEIIDDRNYRKYYNINITGNEPPVLIIAYSSKF